MEIARYLGGESSYAAENAAAIHWLAGQTQDVWVEFSCFLNWDFAVPTMRWVIDQPECERAAAATIFWIGYGGLATMPDGIEEWSATSLAQSPEHELVVAIARRAFTAGYSQASLALAIDDAVMLNDIARARDDPDADLCFAPGQPVPSDLVGPFGDRAPRVLPAADPRHNPMVWDLFDGLGTRWGSRPG